MWIIIIKQSLRNNKNFSIFLYGINVHGVMLDNKIIINGMNVRGTVLIVMS